MDIKITLTGTFSIEVDGGARMSGSDLGPKGLAALAYLVLERDRLVPRDELADVVWAEGVPPTWRAALRGVLARVRSALAGAAPDTVSLACSHGCYRLCTPPGLVVDVEAATASLQVARSARESDEPARTWRHAAEAVAVARRGFLPGAGGRWVERRQAELRELHVEGLELISDAASAKQDLVSALHAAEEALSLQPLRESAHVRTMAAHARGGNRGEALRAYERCRRTLVEELGVCPSPATEAAYVDLLGDEPASPGRWPPAGPPSTNLPRALTSLVGRELQVIEVAGLVSSNRLVTLVGTGGVGKSRLALDVAARGEADHPDGVWLVELAGLGDAGLVVQQVRSTLGLADDSGRDVVSSLAAQLAERRLLLVLDNCEHLGAAVAELVGAVLGVGSGIRFLATSREPLGVAGEVAWTVPPLTIPNPHHPGPFDSLQPFGAVRLFTERARLAAPGIDLAPSATSVAEICRRLDGLPLAIELAAARVRALGVDEIALRLDDRFRLLSCGPREGPARHRSLGAALDWSYQASSPGERRLFRSLSVFASGFTLEAAEVTCSEPERPFDVAHALSGLVGRSLVVVERSASSVRYRLLETLRQYATERLAEEGADGEVRTRHLGWALALAESAAAGLDGPEQAQWLEILDVEHDNLRAALDSSVGTTTADEGARLALALGRFWEVRGHLSEGRARLSTHLAGDAPDPLRARLLIAGGILAQHQGDRVSARRHYRTSLSMFRRLGDRLGAASALHGLGNLAVGDGDLRAARACFEENLSIGRELGEARVTAASLVNLGVMVQFLVEGGGIDPGKGIARAQAYYEEALVLYRDMGDLHGVAGLLENLGVLAPLSGDLTGARRLLQESLDIRRGLGDKVGIAAAARFLGHLALAQGDHATARSLQEESLDIERNLGNTVLVAADLTTLAEIARSEGDDEAAAGLVAESTELRRRLAHARLVS